VYKGSCHCGEVKWQYDGEIGSVNACNCTVCRRYGTLWAYGYLNENIRVFGATHDYVWGDKGLGFHFCKVCGGVGYWLSRSENEAGKYRMAVNLRLADEPRDIETIPVRHFDGFGEFKHKPDDGCTVKDIWY
jgi:hypothetical protein